MDIQNHFNELRDERLKKLLFRAILFIAYPAYLLHSCVTSPLYTMLYSDVETTDFALIFYALNILIDLFVFFLSYSVVIYGAYRLSLKKIRPTFWLAMLSPVFKYLLKLIVSPIVDGIVNLDQILMDLYSIGVSSVLEILQFLIIILIANRYIDKYKGVEAVVSKASSRVGTEGAPDLNILPFKKLFDLKNPLQRGAFTSALIVTFIRILMLVINDISKGLYIIDAWSFFILIGGYILEFVIGIFGYLFMLYIFITIGSKDQ